MVDKATSDLGYSLDLPLPQLSYPSYFGDPGQIKIDRDYRDKGWFDREWDQRVEDGFTHIGIITGQRLRIGKTYAAMRIGREKDPNNWTVSNLEFMANNWVRVMKEAPRGSIGIKDEANLGGMSHRTHYSAENLEVANFVQTSAFEGKHALFPLPLARLMDNTVVDVATFMIVIEGRNKQYSYGSVYTFEHNQFNRSPPFRTPFLGKIDFWPLDAETAAAYEVKRKDFHGEHFTSDRFDDLAMKSDPHAVHMRQLKYITENPSLFTDPKSGKISAILIVKVFAKRKREQGGAEQITQTISYNLRNRAQAFLEVQSEAQTQPVHDETSQA